MVGRMNLANHILSILFWGKQRILIISVLFLMNLLVVSAEELIKPEYTYRYFTTADGLQSMRNECIRQDENGYIWIAGVHGLSCFDGFEFKTYFKGKYSNLSLLDKDAEGNIRAFANNLMFTLDKKNDSFVCRQVLEKGFEIEYVFSKNLPDGYVVYSNHDGTALYAVNDTGLVKILEHKLLNKIPVVIQTLYYDEEKKHLYLPFKDTVKIITDKAGIITYPGINANSFCSYKDGVIALASDGIHKLSNGKSERLFHHKIDIYSTPTKIYANNEGVFFFYTDQYLLRVKDNCIDTLLTVNLVKDFIVDSDENLWVLSAQGLYNLFRLDFRNFVLADQNDVVRNVMCYSDNNAVIAATLNGKIYAISESSIRQINYPSNPYGAAFFYDYGCYTGGAAYLPGPGDVLMLKRNEKRWLNLPFSEFHGFVTELPDGNLLTGGARKLFIFTPEGKFVKEFGKTTVMQSVYAKPCVDKKGRLWLGGFDGITIYDLATDSALVTMFADSLKVVKFMNNDIDGNVWFASENRLFQAIDDSVCLKHIFEYEVLGIFFTRDNLLIVSTLGGLYIFDSNRENYMFYNRENGFTGIESSSGAMVEDAVGNVWLPSLKGIICFNPKHLMYSRSGPKMQLLSMMTSIDNVRWEKTETMKLNYRQDNVRFSYIGLSYLSAQNVRYRYRLTGFQDEFSEPVKLREITFNNLPPGNYNFEIFADTGVDNSQSETLSVHFSIQAAIWQTTMFWVICAILLLFLGAGATLYVQRRKNRRLIERLETEKQLNELRIKSIRLRSIPHFNANVLSALEYSIMNLSKEDANQLLNIYSDFTSRTLREVDKASRSLNDELEYVYLYLKLEKMRFLEKFSYEVDIDPEVKKDIQLPNMILHTYCENAVKHGFAGLSSGCHLRISAHQKEDIVEVCVEDNGVGRVAAEKNKNVRSTKQGLDILSRQIEIYNRFNDKKIVQRIIDLYNGDTPTGTRFVIEVPYGFGYQ